MPTLSPVITLNADQHDSVQKYIVLNVDPPVTTLSVAIDASAVALTFATPGAVPANKNVVIDGESIKIDSASSTHGVTRARNGTTAASHAAGASVSIQRDDTPTAWAKSTVRENARRLARQYPSGTILTKQAEISAAQAAIETALDGGSS